MLPDFTKLLLSSFFSCFPWKRFFSIVLSLLLSLGIYGCTRPPLPEQSIVLNALALQLELTDGAIAISLGSKPKNLAQVMRYRLGAQDGILLEDNKKQILRLTGRCDLKLEGDREKLDRPFVLFLKRSQKGNWLLALPIHSIGSNTLSWITFPLTVYN